MVALYERQPASIVALMEVDPSQVHLYGIATVEPTDEKDVVRISELVEKPTAENAPSNLAIIGRYILQPEVFEALENTEPGSGGEIQLTDALNQLAHTGAGGGVLGVVFRGRRYDTGDRLDYLKAIVQVASERDDLGPDFKEWLKAFTGGLGEK
jgi:UTP--glucose-1-phosphate uridylyltransferase